ncbi:protein of unknown function [Agreia sp. COWG]|nr:protein of unknown function [Agreia sp. COWG]
MRTSRSNMMRFRSGLIGSIRAWLPSLRSTAHQRGASVIFLAGQLRSGSSTAICSWNGRYLWIGIADAVWLFFTIYSSSFLALAGGEWSAIDELRDEEGLRLGLVAAAKKEQTEHGNQTSTGG